eukprot:m.136926 g.136926  ORF g.136926 m.136926 type:complete len:1061 (-) comp29894_c0_seq1:14-3196(-)
MIFSVVVLLSVVQLQWESTAEEHIRNVSDSALVLPVAFYRFENLTNITLDSSPNGHHLILQPNNSIHKGNPPYPAVPQPTPTGGLVGKFVSFNEPVTKKEPMQSSFSQSAKSPLSWRATAPIGLTATKGITIEFLIRPQPGFLRGDRQVLFSSCVQFESIGASVGGKECNASANPLEFTMSMEGFQWYAQTVPPPGQKETGFATDNQSVLFRDEGVLATDYLFFDMGRTWHHIALVKDAVSGNQSVWIDGVCTSKMRMAGNATGRLMAPIEQIVIDSFNVVAFSGGFDELAIYDSALSDVQIWQHYNDTMKNHMPYSNTTSTAPEPQQPCYPNASNVTYFDMTEYPLGTILPSPAGDNNTIGVDVVPCVLQMQYVAGPRFNTSAVTEFSVPYNFNWMDIGYMAGGRTAFQVNLTVALATAMADRWRYGIPLHGLIGASNRKTGVWAPSELLNATIDLANAHPEWPTHTIFPGIPSSTNGSTIISQTLPTGCYLQDAKGNFINVDGSPAVNGRNGVLKKSIRPMSAALAEKQGCPDSLFTADGKNLAQYIFTPLGGQLTRPMDIVNADGEVFVSVDVPAEDYDYSHDPTVLADFKSSGLANWLTYWSTWRTRITNGVTSEFLNDPTLAKGVLKDTAFTMYQVQGTNPFFGNWSQTRNIQSPMLNHQTGKMTRYSAEDFYMTGPHQWYGEFGPWHGIEWLMMTRTSEMALGDTLYSPFIAAGWSGKAELNTRPAQWLGLLKVMSAWGAEWFYAGFFNVEIDSHHHMPDPANWCWQGMMPSYAQAIATNYADFTYHGSLVMANENTTYAQGGDKGDGSSPLLWAGQPNVVCIVRKLDAADVFLVTLTVQKFSNAKGNLKSPQTTTAMVNLEGFDSAISLKARIQGSVYIIRNDTNASATTPVIYQLDTWHLGSHPTYWPADVFEVEAELFEGHLVAAGAIITETPQGVTVSDLYTFTTFVDLSAVGAGGITHVVQSKEVGCKSLRMLARGGDVVITVHAHNNGDDAGEGNQDRDRRDDNQVFTVSTSQSQTWEWVEVVVGENTQCEKITLSGSAHVDKFQITL